MLYTVEMVRTGSGERMQTLPSIEKKTAVTGSASEAEMGSAGTGGNSNVTQAWVSFLLAL